MPQKQERSEEERHAVRSYPGQLNLLNPAKRTGNWIQQMICWIHQQKKQDVSKRLIIVIIIVPINEFLENYPFFGGGGSETVRYIRLFDVVSELSCLLPRYRQAFEKSLTFVPSCYMLSFDVIYEVVWVLLMRHRRIKKDSLLSQHVLCRILECFLSTEGCLPPWVFHFYELRKKRLEHNLKTLR